VNPAPDKGQSLRGQVIDWHFRLQAAPEDRALRAEFDAWLAQCDRRRKAYETVRSIWRDAEDLASVPSTGRPAPSEAPNVVRLRPRRRRLYYAAAAAVAACLVLLALPAIQSYLAADHRTEIAELREIVLDDGSRVTLDAASAIAVDYSSSRRMVKLLSGRAFFEVVSAPDRPFVVTVSDVNVTVTGTSFSVGVSGMGVAVAVETGKVNVSRAGRDVAGLTMGQRLRVSPDGTADQGIIAPDDVASWRGRRIVVHEATVREVVEQIGRHLPGVIVFRDGEIADRRVTGVIDLRRPAEALHAVVDLRQGSILQISPYLTVISSR
jgi:transmembrane sensor